MYLEVLSWHTPEMIYNAYFQSIMNFGIIFWGISASSDNILDYTKELLEL
jgi:hypothetical protein